MGYAILWILVLATALLFLAAFTSLTARSEKKFAREFLPRLIFILILLFFVAATVLAGFIYYVYKISPLWPFYFCLSLTLAFFVGSYWAMQRGLSKSRPGPPAASWPRGALAGSFAIVLCLCLVTFFQLAQDRRFELLALRTNALGIAMKVWPQRLPDESNAASFYHRASLALTGQDFIYDPDHQSKAKKDRPEWLIGNYHLMPEFDPASEAVNKIIEDNRHVIDWINKGVSCPGLYTELDTDNLASTPIFYVSPIRELAWLKRLEAITKAQNGDMNGALADLAMIEHMSDQLLEVPMLISVMSSEMVSRVGYDGLEYILANFQGNPPGALPLYTTGLKPIKPCLVRTFEFEKAFWQDALFQAMSTGPQPWSLSRGPENWPDVYLVFYLSAELKSMRWLSKTYMKIAEQPYPEAMKTLQEASQEFEDKPQGMMARIFAAFFTGYYDRPELFEARRRLAALALAAFNFKQDNGHFPEKLEDLVPKYIDAVPIDPFDLKPLKMKALDDGLDLYSIGIDSKTKSNVTPQGPVHFYLSPTAYQEFRVKPFQEEQAKKKSSRKKRK